MGHTTYKHTTTPSNPPSGYTKFYFKADGSPYKLDSSGTEAEVGSGGGASFPELQLFAAQLDSPLTSDWAVADPAGGAADSNNSALYVLRFDDTDEEGTGFSVDVPSGATNIVLTIKSRAETAPGSVSGVALLLYNRGIPDNADVESWSSGFQMDDLSMPTNERWQKDSETIALSALGVTAGETTQFELVRDAIDAGDDLSGDWTLWMIKVGFS